MQALADKPYSKPQTEESSSSIRRTLHGRADDNESPWASNNLINIHDEHYTYTHQPGFWRAHLESRLSEQNSLIMDMNQPGRIINIHFMSLHQKS